jgi:hypothetical protein
MKKLILLLILLPTLCFAGLQEKQCAVIAQKNANASCADASCTGFMFCQNFEGTGYDNSETWTYETWTEKGTVDPDSTSPALRGTQSCAIANTSYIKHDTGGTYTELYSFARYQFADATPTVVTYVYRNQDGTADFGAIRLGTSGKLTCFHGTATTTAETALSDATTYYIWIHFKASTGAGDGIMTATVSTTRNPAEATAALGCSVTNGDDADTNIDSVWFGNSADGGAGVSVDQILVKTTAIGTVCE